MQEVPVTLVSIGGGAAVELFDIELERVLANIKDVNTDPKTRRRITLVVDIGSTAISRAREAKMWGSAAIALEGR